MIPISKPIIPKKAKKYLLDSLNSGWISGAGPYVAKFEDQFANFTGAKFAIACSSGTTAIHLALASLNIGPGDEVILPSFTMISTILPVIYTGATPILVDVEDSTGNIDPNLVEKKLTHKTRAIIPVHINGHPADMTSLLNLAQKYNLSIIEDAAEAHGAEYKLPPSSLRRPCLPTGRQGSIKKVGSIGNLGCFSFYANKIVTAGEGGMVTTNSSQLSARLRSLRNLARSPKKHFYHQEIAFNYRMSSLQAALGLASLEEVEMILQRKRKIASLYNQLLKDIKSIELPSEASWAKSVYWQYGIKIKSGSKLNRDQLADILASNNIETRNFFIPLHLQPVFKKMGLFKGEKYPVAENLGKVGLNIPTGPNIKISQIRYIAKIIKDSLE